MSVMQLDDPTTSDGIANLSVAALLRLSVAVAVPVCAFALLWTLSVAHYFFMSSDAALRASFLAPAVRVVEHVLLLPVLTGSYFLAALLFAGGGRPRRVLFEQLALLVAFSLLVRPVYFLATRLGWEGGAREPFDFAHFADAMDLDSWLSTALNYSLVYAAGLFILFGLIVLAKYRREQLRAAAMRANWLQAQLETLRVQLHPHFLFNTLNTISALVGSRPEEARDLIAQLAALLRDSIDGAEELYPLRREVELANKYLRIMSARFGARLNPALDVMPGLEDCPVPHGLLLTLLENGVTHGVSMVIGDSELSLRCALEHDLLVVEVRNRYDPDAAPLPAHRGGLAALSTRLSALYGDAFALEYGGNGADLWYTRVKLPAECAPVGSDIVGAGRHAPVHRVVM